MYSCQSERYGATSFIFSRKPRQGNTGISGGSSPRHFRSHFPATNMRASIKSRSSASYIWSKDIIPKFLAADYRALSS